MKIKNESGFTLIELMVVVAIIGILSAVAVPSFKKYQAKSRTTEAKLSLASVYTAQVAADADYGSFATCLDFLGYAQPDVAYYAVGFAGAHGNVGNAAVVAAGGTGCLNVAASRAFPATKAISGLAVMTAADLGGRGGTSANDGASFIVLARGRVSSVATTAAGVDSTAAADQSKFSIDENKNIANSVTGY